MHTQVITSGSEDTITLFQACSISKAITALAVARIIDDGHLTYSTMVSDYLPRELVDLVTGSGTRRIFRHLTVSHLLSHTSGLSQHGFPEYDSMGAIPTYQRNPLRKTASKYAQSALYLVPWIAIQLLWW